MVPPLQAMHLDVESITENDSAGKPEWYSRSDWQRVDRFARLNGMGTAGSEDEHDQSD